MPDYYTYTDGELAALLRNGNEDAFAEIYCRYKDRLYIHALKLLKDPDEAQDVLQEIFTSLWNKADVLNLDIPLRKYLYRAVKNRIFNIFEHRKVRAAYVQTLQNMLERGSWETDQQLLEKELMTVIEGELARLPPRMRKVFELSRMRQYSHREIAGELKISDKTVKKQIQNALKVLRAKISIPIFFIFFYYLSRF